MQISAPPPPPWPPAPLAPPYAIVEQVLPPHSADADLETIEARLVFRDWLDREVSVFARRSHPRRARNGAAILHIVGGAQTIHPGDLAVWISQGYAVASFDWQLAEVGGRAPERRSRFPAGLVPQHAATPSLDAAVLPVALQAASVTLDWLSHAPGVDAKKLGVVGISWGGYLSWLLAAYDARVRALVPAFGCGGLFEPGRSAPDHAPEVLAYWREHWEPLTLGPRISASVCFLSGTNDFFGDLLDAEQLLATLRVPRVRHYLPNVDHSLSPVQTHLASTWLRHHLLDGPPVPASAPAKAGPASDSSPSDPWWTEDLAIPAQFRCWLPGPPPPDRPVLAFAQHHSAEGLTQSTPVVHLPASRPSSSAASSAPASTIPFGLGWRWEVGSTRHFAHDASATPPASLDAPWLLRPARPDNSAEAVLLLLHPRRSSLRALAPAAPLRLGWSAEPLGGILAVQLELLPPHRTRHDATLRWDSATASILLDPAALSTLPPDFAWKKVARIQLKARQPRTPFHVGPLEG
jgi:hypothetical protein